MPSIKRKCESCGAELEVHFGQSANHWISGLGWWSAYHCPECGNAAEADGGADMPDALRQMIIEEEGLWITELAPGTPLDAHVLKAVRGVLSLAMEQVRALKRAGTTTLASGTRAEMEQIKSDLAKRGVVALARRQRNSRP
jgi:hypothetical protein